jgi:hypothetical protein
MTCEGTARQSAKVCCRIFRRPRPPRLPDRPRNYPGKGHWWGSRGRRRGRRSTSHWCCRSAGRGPRNPAQAAVVAADVNTAAVAIKTLSVIIAVQPIVSRSNCSPIAFPGRKSSLSELQIWVALNLADAPTVHAIPAATAKLAGDLAVRGIVASPCLRQDLSQGNGNLRF